MKMKIITTSWKLEKGTLKAKLLPVIKGGSVSLFVKKIYLDDVFIQTNDKQYEVLLTNVRSLLPDEILI